MKHGWIFLPLYLALFSGCGTDLVKDEPGKPGERPNRIQLERHFQRVVRYDCAGRVTSDQVETVKKPNRWVTIRPDTTAPITSSDFRSRTTGDVADLISGPGTFRVKWTNGDLGMRVLGGLNVIEYRFRSDATVAEEGTVSLDVTYVEKSLPGLHEIRPSEESCQ